MDMSKDTATEFRGNLGRTLSKLKVASTARIKSSLKVWISKRDKWLKLQEEWGFNNLCLLTAWTCKTKVENLRNQILSPWKAGAVFYTNLLPFASWKNSWLLLFLSGTKCYRSYTNVKGRALTIGIPFLFFYFGGILKWAFSDVAK